MIEAAAGGGGAIQVIPSVLESAGGALANVASQTGGDASSLNAGRAGPAACDPRAAGACAAMQSAVEAAMTLLQRGTGTLSSEVISASAAYVVTDVTQFSGAGGR